MNVLSQPLVARPTSFESELRPLLQDICTKPETTGASRSRPSSPPSPSLQWRPAAASPSTQSRSRPCSPTSGATDPQRHAAVKKVNSSPQPSTSLRSRSRPTSFRVRGKWCRTSPSSAFISSPTSLQFNTRVPEVHVSDGGESQIYSSMGKRLRGGGQVLQTSHNPTLNQNQPPRFADQFDMYLYQSQHITTPVLSPAAPQLFIELPSDSDSSRRPSPGFCSSVQNSPVETPTSEKILTRRASFSGDLQASASPDLRPTRPSFLDVPQCRSRGISLPDNIGTAELYRLRNFSVSGKKVVNKGDIYKTRSSNSINSIGSSIENIDLNSYNSASSGSHRDGSHRSGRSYIATPNLSRGSSCTNLSSDTATQDRIYRVLMMGGPGVGKSSLCSQFLSSDHINTYIKIEDTVEKEVSVAVNGEEGRMVFIDHQSGEMSVERMISTYQPHCVLVVLAVDDYPSLETAENILHTLKTSSVCSPELAVILVANKSDLVRNRVVRTSDGKSLAVKYQVKYIETSPGINHNVDEVLVGVFTQISLRQNQEKKTEGSSKMLGLLGRVYEWGMPNMRTKSCSNLNTI